MKIGMFSQGRSVTLRLRVTALSGFGRIVQVVAIVALITMVCMGASELALAQGAPAAAAPAAENQVFSPAPVTSPEQPTFFSTLVSMLPMLAICYLIFYFMVVKPQEARAKKQKGMLESLKWGDSVVTSGGILGKVVGVEKDHVSVEIAPSVKIKVELAHITKRGDAGAKSAAA